MLILALLWRVIIYCGHTLADEAGTSTDLKLVVVHTAVASGFIPKITWW